MNAQHDETPGPLGCASADAPLWSRLAGRICRFGLTPVLAAALACGATFARAEAPKRGGVLTYMIPADGGTQPGWASRDHLRRGARDGAVLQRADPCQSGQPVLDHRFRVRPVHRDAEADGQRADLHLQDPQGREVSRRLAPDGAGRGGELEQDRPSPEGCCQCAREQLRDGGHHHGAGRRDGGVQAEIRHPDVPAGAGRPLRLHLFQEEARPGHALVREEHHGVGALQADRIPDRPVHQG